MLLNPIADEIQGFKEEWLRFYGRVAGDRMIKAILVDPANAKKTNSDYTCAVVVGFAEDDNVYILDMRRDRLNLSQRWTLLANLHRQWTPRHIAYEEYGMMANPSWGSIVKPSEFRADWETCKGKPREVARFKQYRLNL